MVYLLLVLRVLHIAAAIAAGGAIIFQYVALLPAIEGLGDAPRAELRQRLIARWRPVVFALIGVLLLTGLATFAIRAIEYRESPAKGLYHALFGLKFVAALLLFHGATILVLPGEKFDKYRQRTPFWLKYMTGLLAVIILLAAGLRFFPELTAK